MVIMMLRPDIVLKDLRGNINTRIAKLNAGEYDAIILAATGIQKLKIENEVNILIQFQQMLWFHQWDKYSWNWNYKWS